MTTQEIIITVVASCLGGAFGVMVTTIFQQVVPPSIDDIHAAYLRGYFDAVDEIDDEHIKRPDNALHRGHDDHHHLPGKKSG